MPFSTSPDTLTEELTMRYLFSLLLARITAAVADAVERGLLIGAQRCGLADTPEGSADADLAGIRARLMQSLSAAGQQQTDTAGTTAATTGEADAEAAGSSNGTGSRKRK